MANRPYGPRWQPGARRDVQRPSRSRLQARPLLYLRAALSLLVVWGFVALLGSPAGAQEMPSASFAHTQAVRMARRGQYREALHVLRLLHEANPEDARMLGDYVAVLNWADRDQAAIDLARKLELETAPDYVVEAVARSLRNLGRYDEAAELFEEASQRFPENSGLRLQQALARAEAGELEAALPTILDLVEEEPENVDVLVAAALIRRWRGEYLASTELCERVLAIAPEHDTAYRMRVLSISDLGAAQKAYDEALRRPDLFESDELELFRMNRATTVVRWGTLPAPRAELSDSEAALGSGLVEEVLLSTSSPSMKERARFDRIVALRNRKRPADAVDEYEAYLREQGGLDPLDVPVWVLVPVAESYVAVGEPRKAIPLFEHARSLLHTRSAERHTAALGLFVANLHADDFDAAAEVLEDIRAEEPAWRWKPDGKQAFPNPRRLQTDIAGLARFTWADRLAEAQDALEDAVERAPFNAELRRELAGIYLSRGWPEKALEEAQYVLGLQPDHPGALDTIARAQMELREWEEARATMASLKGLPGVRREQLDGLQETYDLKRSWELRAELWYGENDPSGFFGGENAHGDVTLYSAPIDDHLRLFGHAYYSWASFPEGDASLLRGGLGAEYAERHWRARAEYHVDSTRELIGDGTRDTKTLGGIGGAVEMMPDDRWTFEARYDSISLETPLRARQQGIEGELFGLSAVHRFDDDASVRAGIAAIDMSDGNDREYAFLSARKRVLTRPHYRLIVQPELYTSRNSLGGQTVYYNPESDFEGDLVLINEWVGLRSAKETWLHRAIVTLGGYSQEGFGAEFVGGLGYEGEVSIENDFGATFGITWLSHPYDGRREGRWWVYLRPVFKL